LEFNIDWIDLERASSEDVVWAPAQLAWRVVPSTEVRFTVTDADGLPCMGAFEITTMPALFIAKSSRNLIPVPETAAPHGPVVRLISIPCPPCLATFACSA